VIDRRRRLQRRPWIEQDFRSQGGIAGCDRRAPARPHGVLYAPVARPDGYHAKFPDGHARHRRACCDQHFPEYGPSRHIAAAHGR